MTHHAALILQSIEDVEDTRDGATMHLQELSALIDQVRANIEAIHGATLSLPLSTLLLVSVAGDAQIACILMSCGKQEQACDAVNNTHARARPLRCPV